MTTLIMLRVVVLISSFTPCAAADEPKKMPQPPTYKVPKSWEKIEPDKLGFTTARFQVGKGEKAVSVTLTKLGGIGGTVTANINRWRGQVGLESLEEKEALKTLQAAKVDGLPGHIFDVTGPEVEGKVTQRIVVVFVTKGEETWFVRIGGPAGSVAEQKADFDAFVKSMRFEK